MTTAQHVFHFSHKDGRPALPMVIVATTKAEAEDAANKTLELFAEYAGWTYAGTQDAPAPKDDPGRIFSDGYDLRG